MYDHTKMPTINHKFIKFPLMVVDVKLQQKKREKNQSLSLFLFPKYALSSSTVPLLLFHVLRAINDGFLLNCNAKQFYWQFLS